MLPISLLMNDIKTHFKNPEQMKYLDNSYTQSRKKKKQIAKCERWIQIDVEKERNLPLCSVTCMLMLLNFMKILGSSRVCTELDISINGIFWLFRRENVYNV